MKIYLDKGRYPARPLWPKEVYEEWIAKATKNWKYCSKQQLHRYKEAVRWYDENLPKP